MPPRFVYWTIIAGGLPTAFRATERDDLVPTFRRIKEKHPDAQLKWFARGRLWESKEDADRERDARRARPNERRPHDPGRGKGWRPGGEHRDPRQPYKDAKKARNQDRRQERFARKHGDTPRFDKPGSDARTTTRPPVDKPRFDKPRSHAPAFGKPRFDKPRSPAPSFDKPRFDKPRFDKPRSPAPAFGKPRSDWAGKRPPGQRPPGDKPGRFDRPRGGSSSSGSKPFGSRPAGATHTRPGWKPRPPASGSAPRRDRRVDDRDDTRNKNKRRK